MCNINKKVVYLLATLSICLPFAGCGRLAGFGGRSKETATATELGTTIGALADVIVSEPISVEGYSLVGGLNGTGSAECPPLIREYLKQYILTQLPERIDVNKFINSLDTAVVYVEAVIPAAASKNQRFDVRVITLAGTQTTSLENGWLYGTELILTGTFGINTKVLAKAEGPLFVDKLGTSKANTKIQYVLGGGKVIEESKINLVFHKTDFRITNLVRNRLNERFGYGTANAVSANRIELKVPATYKGQKLRFAEIVKALYFYGGPEVTQERIGTLIRKLAVSDNKLDSEIALEAIGAESLDKLSVLLNSTDEQVRLRAARCIANLGGFDSSQTLQEIAMDKNSAYRLEAFETMAKADIRDEVAAISRQLLYDDNFDIRLAAYEQLRKLEDFTVTKELIAKSFYLEQIPRHPVRDILNQGSDLPRAWPRERTAQNEYKEIFVSRSGQPRIVLFGAPIYCSDNIFVQSADGNITINALSGQKYVSIIRKHPRRPNVVLQLRSSLALVDIIRSLCEEPLKNDEQTLRGLGVSYADMIALLKQMCKKGAIIAEFHAGPIPKIG